MQKSIVILTLILVLISFSAVNAENAEISNPWEKAKERGVHFRAIGNEPGWLVEIRDEKTIKFVNGYGDIEIKAPVDDLWLGPAGEDKIYYVENDIVQFQVIIMKKKYEDNMSGEKLPYQVRVVFPNKSYVGGGKLLLEPETANED